MCFGDQFWPGVPELLLATVYYIASGLKVCSFVYIYQLKYFIQCQKTHELVHVMWNWIIKFEVVCKHCQIFKRCSSFLSPYATFMEIKLQNPPVFNPLLLWCHENQCIYIINLFILQQSSSTPSKWSDKNCSRSEACRVGTECYK